MVTANKKKVTIYKLKDPFEYANEMVEQLEIRRVKAGDMREFGNNPGVSEMLDMLATCAGMNPRMVDELSVKDMNGAIEVLNSFL